MFHGKRENCGKIGFSTRLHVRERKQGKERNIDENKDRDKHDSVRIGRMTYLSRYRRNMAPKELYRAISSGDLMSLFRGNRPRVSRLSSGAIEFSRSTELSTRREERNGKAYAAIAKRKYSCRAFSCTRGSRTFFKSSWNKKINRLSG